MLIAIQTLVYINLFLLLGDNLTVSMLHHWQVVHRINGFGIHFWEYEIELCSNNNLQICVASTFDYCGSFVIMINYLINVLSSFYLPNKMNNLSR